MVTKYPRTVRVQLKPEVYYDQKVLVVLVRLEDGLAECHVRVGREESVDFDGFEWVQRLFPVHNMSYYSNAIELYRVSLDIDLEPNGVVERPYDRRLVGFN